MTATDAHLPRLSRIAGYGQTALLARTGVEAIAPAVLIAMLQLGRSSADAALLLASVTGAAALGGFVVGTVLDSVRRPASAYGLLLAVMTVALLAMSRELSTAALLVLMTIGVVVGLGQSALSGALTAQLSRLVPHQLLPRALSVDVAVFSIAGIAGPLIVTWVATRPAPATLYAAAVPLALATASVPLMRLPTRDRASRRWYSTLDGFRTLGSDPVLREVTVVTSFTSIAQAGFVVAAPQLSRQLTGGLGFTGVLLTTLAAGNLAASAVTARWPVRHPPRTVVRVCAVAYGMLVASLALTHATAATLAVALAIGAVLSPLLAAIFLARFHQTPAHLQSQVFATAAGLRSLTFAAGAAALGVLAGVDVRWCLLAAGGAQLAGLLVARYLPTPCPQVWSTTPTHEG